MIEIGGYTTHPVGKRLSNFTERHFVLDGVFCRSIEGVLQAFKCKDIARQQQICALVGKFAWEAGQEFNHWKLTQLLCWNNTLYERTSIEYRNRVTSLFDAVYDQDPTYADELLALGEDEIAHPIGKANPAETVLTEAEFITEQLNRLRERARRESLSHTI